MNRVLCSAALTLLLLGCAAEEQRSTPPADTAAAPASPSASADTAPAPATTTQPPAAAPAAHDVTGAYFPMDALPAEFAELEHLSLATIDENAAPAPLNGFLRPKKRSAEDYKLVDPSLVERKLTFVTTAHGGIHYEFDGEFQVLDDFAANPPAYETVVLSGTLRRMRGGQTVASTPVRFRYEAGG